jgi:hypothetical protein
MFSTTTNSKEYERSTTTNMTKSPIEINLANIQVNNSITHQFNVGDLVELNSGVRLFVVCISKYRDGTPLYYLSIRKDDTDASSPIRSWDGGYSEESLKLVNTDGKLESDIKSELTGILEECLAVTDEWGGCKLASWQWGNNVVVDGIDVAVEEIMKLFNRK